MNHFSTQILVTFLDTKLHRLDQQSEKVHFKQSLVPFYEL